MRTTVARRSVVLAVLVAATGCAQVQAPVAPDPVVCTAHFVYGLTVTVQDAATGRRVCDAQVTTVSGTYRETLIALGPADDCSYAGAGERAGVYELSASKTGYATVTMSNVRVDADVCHVIPVRVTLQLNKAN